MTAVATPSTARRLGTWAAMAMVVSEVVGVGIFLSPATMMRTLGSAWAVSAVWVGMGALSAAGALCYAELSTRFPHAGGAYIFLREAFGARWAFVYGWMAVLVTDPGIAAALGIGLAQYLLVTIGAPPAFTPMAAIGAIVVFGLLTLAGLEASARIMRWTAVAKLAIVGILVAAAFVRARQGLSADRGVSFIQIPPEALAGSVIAAFFAFGGWWELGRMTEDVESPRRTMPRALVGGVALVTLIYALVTLAYELSTAGPVAPSDEAVVSTVGAALFGDSAGRLLAAMVVVAVSGSLAAVLLGAPRVYLAMARDGIFPSRLLRFDERRRTSTVATILQVSVACGLVLLGTFDQILGFFVPVTIFFLGMSAAAVLRLPRPDRASPVFRAPLHPLPVLLFLLLIGVVLLLFLVGRPVQTLLGVAVASLGLPVSYLVLPRGGSPR
jgi:APA family basic amino acid/polyamine antiporter